MMVQQTAQFEILNRLVMPKDRKLRAEVAEYLLGLEFSEADHARVAELADKSQEGTLTDDERLEYDTYVFVNDMLAVLRVKAMRAAGMKLPSFGIPPGSRNE